MTCCHNNGVSDSVVYVNSPTQVLYARRVVLFYAVIDSLLLYAVIDSLLFHAVTACYCMM